MYDFAKRPSMETNTQNCIEGSNQVLHIFRFSARAFLLLQSGNSIIDKLSALGLETIAQIKRLIKEVELWETGKSLVQSIQTNGPALGVVTRQFVEIPRSQSMLSQQIKLSVNFYEIKVNILLVLK